jgi:hypothetical protein
MKNAFKRLRGEAVRRRKGSDIEDDGDQPDEDDQSDAMGEPAVEEVDGSQRKTKKAQRKSARGKDGTENEEPVSEHDLDEADHADDDFAEDEAPKRKTKVRSKVKSKKR